MRRQSVQRHGILAGDEVRLGERVLVRAEAAGDRETLVAGDDRSVHLEPHFPVRDGREETGAEGVPKIDVVEARCRNDDVAEGQRGLVRVRQVHDRAARRERARLCSQPLREPIRAIRTLRCCGVEPIEPVRKTILAVEDPSPAAGDSRDSTAARRRAWRRGAHRLDRLR